MAREPMRHATLDPHQPQLSLRREHYLVPVYRRITVIPPAFRAPGFWILQNRLLCSAHQTDPKRNAKQNKRPSEILFHHGSAKFLRSKDGSKKEKRKLLFV